MSENELRAVISELRENAKEAQRRCRATKSDFERGQSNAFEVAAMTLERRIAASEKSR